MKVSQNVRQIIHDMLDLFFVAFLVPFFWVFSQHYAAEGAEVLSLLMRSGCFFALGCACFIIWRLLKRLRGMWIASRENPG